MLGLAQRCTVSAAVRSIPQHPQYRLRDKQQTITNQNKNNDVQLKKEGGISIKRNMSIILSRNQNSTEELSFGANCQNLLKFVFFTAVQYTPLYTHHTLAHHLPLQALSHIYHSQPMPSHIVTLITTHRCLLFPCTTSLVVLLSFTLFGNTFAMPLALAPRLVLYSPINP